MMNYNEIKEALANGTTATESKVINAFRNNKLAYELVLKNCQNIGGKRFCYIPLDLLEIDEDYQRIFCISMQKVDALTRKWDKNKCDPVLVAPHPETSTFSVIDGSHRMLAAGALKQDGVVAVLADDLSDDPTKRKIQEIETKALLNQMYNGSLENFMNSYLANQKLSGTEIAELQRIISMNGR